MKNERINRNTILLMWFLVGLGCLYIFHMYIIGNYTIAFYDVGTDGKDQYIMWYNGIVNSLRDGNFSPWDFRNGFGMNTMGHHLTEPFLIPIYILGVIFGPEHITWYMVWMEIFRIFVAATLCYWYLSEFDFSEKSKLIATVIYAFNSYMMVWGQHYALGSSVVYFPAILIFAERVVKKKKFSIGLCLISCLAMLSSFYQGYMCMFGGGAYICIRILMQEKETIRERGKAFFAGAGAMILGVLMSAWRFFPSAAAQVGSSERMAAKQSLVERLFHIRLWSTGINKSIIYRLFSSCIQGNGNETYVGSRNFYEDPELFFSTLFVILLIQYLVCIPKQKGSRRSKCMQYLCVILCTASVVITNVTTLFNGLYGPFFRHTFVLMPVFAVMICLVLDRILKEKQLNMPALIISVLMITAVYMKAYRILPEQQFKDNAMILWLTGLGMAALLWMYCKNKFLDGRTCYTLLLLIVTINIVSDSYLCYNDRVALPKNHPEYFSETYHSDVNAALDWLEANDDTFYRVEKDYFTASSCFDSLAQDYRGISAYNSNQNADIKEFVAQIWPQLNHERDVNHIQFMNALWDSTFAGLTDVKYILSKSGDMDVDGYELIHQEGAVYIYQNSRTQSLGKFFTQTMTQEQYEANQDNLNTRALLTDTLILEDENEKTLTDSEIKAYEKKEISGILTDDSRKVYETDAQDDTKTVPFVVELNLDTEKRAAYESAIMEFTMLAEKRTVVTVQINDGYSHDYVHNWETERKMHIELPEDAQKVTLTVENPTGYIRISDVQVYGTEKEPAFSDQAEITVEAPKKDSLLNGHIRAKEDGYVMLAVPNENGWSVTLNGEKQELSNGDYGFISFPVAAGEYDMTVKFTAPLLRLGGVVSVISTLVFISVVIMIKKRENIRRKK